MKYAQKRNLVIAIIIFLAGLLAGGRLLGLKIPKFSQDSNVHFVVSVIDGDTIRIEDEQRVRLIGIDAPASGWCYYHTSTQALKDLVQDKMVRLEKDITDKDKYGRLLRYVFVVNEGEDNIFVNDYLLHKGFAKKFIISPDTQYRDLFTSAQQEAYRNKLGMWGECDYELEGEYRQTDDQPTDPECLIKGNISDRAYGKVYFIPGCTSYEASKIDFSRGEQYFCTEQEAIDAGFRKGDNCP
ncbi:thermonuclease family protein [Patescibacteria group bacterium]